MKESLIHSCSFVWLLQVVSREFPNKIEGFVGRQDFQAKVAQSSPQWPKMAQDDLDGQKWRAISVSQYNPQNFTLSILFLYLFYSLGHPVSISKILVRDHEIVHNI